MQNIKVGKTAGRGGYKDITFNQLRVLQGNLNHCRAAQDLLLQCLVEWSVALAVLAEPYRVPNHPRWFSDVGNTVAIYWGGTQGDPCCSILEKGSGFVAVQWGHLAVLGCYISPNSGLGAYEAYLYELAACIRRCLPRPLIVLGDFNAHSRVWGDKRDDRRGDIIQEWAAEFNLQLLNQGSTSTCVRWQGESIVDLTWATPPASRMVSRWRVAEEVVTLSDHRHIVFVVKQKSPCITVCQNRLLPRRWSLKKLDRDLLIAAACVAAWPEQSKDVLPDPEEETTWFRDTMITICDASMPRTTQTKKRKGMVYWWSEDIAQLRRICLRSRRQYTRARRRRRSTAEAIANAYTVYRNATKALQAAIANAKAQSWKELIEELDRDPWGRPYKMVIGKLRPWVPPLTETLDPDLVGRIIEGLFPRAQNSSSTTIVNVISAWSDELDVSMDELNRVVRRLAARNTAPGPDSIPSRALMLALGALGNRLSRLFNSCLRLGIFPTSWKEARLVLLKKEGRPMDSPSAYRPICLLDEAGKLFERIIANRLSDHLSRVGPDLSESQFGFRRGRSTVDAIIRVRTFSDQAVCAGGVALAVSLDIVNAFNSLPWTAIREALTYHNVPPYLRNIVEAYLCDRSIQYAGRDGLTHRREVNCGVPQGSVLGPLLWNLAYDAVLRAIIPSGVNVVCYADDTVVLARGGTFEETSRLAEVGVACITAKIHELGLKVAPHKTEAIWFHRLPRRLEPPSTSIRVGNANVQVGRYLKYLGLTLDGRWGFEEHFERLVPRIQKFAGAMHGLLPNLRGPKEEVRRLYAGVVRSIALYGAPVWSQRLSDVQRLRAKLNSVQRKMAIRVARGYRTISFEAATVLARFPPLDILAIMDARVYTQTRAVCQRSENWTDAGTLRRQANRQALDIWRKRLEEQKNVRQRTVKAILPNFEAWLERKSGNVTFRLTQVLTGHGCFGEYLCRIGREATPRCHHCEAEVDSAQHTLAVCPAWEPERCVLVSCVGRDLSPPAVVAAMLAENEAWKAVVHFCETIMCKKEAAERDRERDDPARRRKNQGSSNQRLASSTQ